MIKVTKAMLNGLLTQVHSTVKVVDDISKCNKKFWGSYRK